jgi:hypothetical protein
MGIRPFRSLDGGYAFFPGLFMWRGRKTQCFYALWYSNNQYFQATYQQISLNRMFSSKSLWLRLLVIYFTPQQWQQRGEEYRQERLRLSEMEEQTIDNFRIGEMQTGRDHRLVATGSSYVSDTLGIMRREARSGHQCQFVMQVLPRFTHYPDDAVPGRRQEPLIGYSGR